MVKIFTGIDESNHGRFPEVYAMVFSQIPQDILPYEQEIPKLRKKFKQKSQFKIFTSNSRDYSFLLVNQTDYQTIPKKFWTGTILASLLGENWGNSQKSLEVYIDGEINSSQKLNSKSIIEEICNLEKNQITINSGPNFDRIYPIVNLADQLAYQIYRKSLEQIAVDPKKREIIY
jgi:hypothetical protein